MVTRKVVATRRARPSHLARRLVLPLGLLLLSASCVHGNGSEHLAGAGTDPQPAALPPAIIPDLSAAGPETLQPLSAEEAAAANAAIPIARLPDPRAASFVLHGRTALDQLRSADCMAQAIYYEARSETEDGQRAVAQVVLNRVRHPAYPASVCGVVYQGPMRPGGGCQFSFTCDGSLAVAPTGLSWARARRIAAEALAGSVYAPVGHSTHYHTTAVLPFWAPKLLKSAIIGSHIFYRLPGTLGAPSTFVQSYAGREPLPVPAMTAAPPTRKAALVPSIAVADLPQYTAVTAPPDNLPKVKLTDNALPLSRVREAFSRSGMVKDRPEREDAGSEEARF